MLWGSIDIPLGAFINFQNGYDLNGTLTENDATYLRKLSYCPICNLDDSQKKNVNLEKMIRLVSI